MNIVAQTQKDTPKYMRLCANTQYELAQNIDAAAKAAQLSEEPGLAEACYQLCYQQLMDQLLDEYLLDVASSLKQAQVKDKNTLQAAMLKLLPLCAAQWQLQGGSPAKLASFQAGFKLVVAHSLLDGLDIMSAKDMWRFDIQRNVQQVQEHIFAAVEQYTL